MAELAVTDPLTELRNHRAFHEDLVTSMHQVERNGTPLSLAILDVDGLKAVNDTLGHQAGDDCHCQSACPGGDVRPER